ncbi:nucleoside diphosphate kinase 7-like isoform X1 [Lytechinus variegatus]|uniref:nucleoside diphosphate kinase 7-like isoform X1 n=1 Tax=Lytechinus variegatus TaxID=7654 RepID=UPI001BB1B2CA|nr:nucleoside diphosphate kinase 7-like isoform X1 [Lytechinus variegatus]
MQASSAQDGRYSFICEWYDNNAAIIRRYQFLFYPNDNTIEMYDLKNRRQFLKRSQCNSVHLKDLYVGSIVNVHSRQLTLVEYADDFTKRALTNVKQKTLGLIKPDAISKFGPIIDMTYKQGFVVTNAKMTRLTRGQAEEFYREHSGKPFYNNLVSFMSSGPIVAMELITNNGIGEWRTLLGPTDSATARSDAPGSIRAKFGTDNTRNACHGSDSMESADREISFFFGQPAAFPNNASLRDCTCCIIKPSAIKEGLAGQIMTAICNEGFEVTAMEMFHMEKANSEEFFEVYKGVVTEYMEMVDELTSGACYVLEISSPSGKFDNVAKAFREFVGPADPEIARTLRPRTLRARFGVNKVNNAVHCTDLPEDALLETEYFFRILSQ